MLALYSIERVSDDDDQKDQSQCYEYGLMFFSQRVHPRAEDGPLPFHLHVTPILRLLSRVLRQERDYCRGYGLGDLLLKLP